MCFLRDRSPASKATWNRLRQALWPDASPPISPWDGRLACFRERRRSARCSITFPPPIRLTISRPTSPSTCCPRSTKRPDKSSAATSAPGTPKSAAAPSRAWISFLTHMPESELGSQIARFLEELKRNNVSPHTLAAYGSDLAQFLEYFSPPGAKPPEPSQFEVWNIREWLGSLYSQNLSPVSMRRKLAALRAFFRFMAREETIGMNPARLVRTPKAPLRLPGVMSEEQVNGLLDDVAAGKQERPHPTRDVAIFEFLYGCGLRVSELVGLNLDDIDRGEHWLRIRGKGRKE